MSAQGIPESIRFRRISSNGFLALLQRPPFLFIPILFFLACKPANDPSQTLSTLQPLSYQEGRHAKLSGDYMRAMSSFRNAISTSPNYLPTFIEMTSCCPDSGYLLQCDSLFSRLMRIQPNQPGPTFGKALIHLYHCRYDSAIELLQSLLDEGFSGGLIRLKLAEAKRCKGLFVESNALLDILLKRDATLIDSALLAAILDLRGENLYDLGDLQGAERSHLAGLELADRLGDPALQARACLHISCIHSEMEEYLAAEQKLTRAFLLARRSGEPLLLAECLRQKGVLDWVRGYFSRAASEGYEPAARIFNSLNHQQSQAQLLRQIALLHYNQQEYYDAMIRLRAALKIQLRIGDLKGRAATLYYMALCHYSLGEGGETIKLLHQAYTLAHKINYYPVLEGVARQDYQPLGSKADAYYAKMSVRRRFRSHTADLRTAAMKASWDGRYQEAIELARGLLPYEAEQDAPKHRITSYLVLGSSFLGLGELDSAKVYYKRCLELAESVGFDKRTFAEAHLGLGKALEKENPEAALFEFQQANHYEQEIYDANPADEFRATWAGRMAESDLAVIRTLARLAEEEGDNRGNCWQAFRHWQRCTNRRFNERLSRQTVLSGSAEQPDQLQRSMPTSSCLIGYLVDEEEMLVFAVSARDFRLFTRPIGRRALEGKIELLRALLDQALFAPKPADDGQIQGLLRGLFLDLIEPVQQADLLEGIDHLYIVPNQVLHHLPFACLMAPAAGGKDSIGAQYYLIEKYKITYLPSAAVGLQWLPGALRCEDHAHLPALVLAPFSDRFSAVRQEVEAVTGFDPAHTHSWLDETATELRFKREAAGFSALHFATHSSMTAGQPESSHVALRAGGGEDGLLSAAEIAGLRLKAGLVVLSSCESALAAARYYNPNLARNYHPTDELVGLTQAFLLAGASQVVATLWPVQDQASAEFMARFYTHLRKCSLADALASTQRELIWEKSSLAAGSLSSSDPAFWAGYKLVALPK